MRMIARSLPAVCLALFGAIVLAVSWTMTTAVQLLATALIMGGTLHPLSTPPDDPVLYINPYMSNAVDGYINPAADAPTGTTGTGTEGVGDDDDRYAVITPEQFFPVFGSMTVDQSVAEGFANLNGCVRGTGCQYNTNTGLDPDPPLVAPAPGGSFVIFGYSQSAVIASLVKQDLIDNPPEETTIASFFLLANPMRPNGGILALGAQGPTIPIPGVTFYGATATNSCEMGTCYPTTDVAAQYDAIGGDAPVNPTNLLAVLNAAAGFYYLHGDLQNGSFDNALYQGSYGDTDYYLVPARRLPILLPFGPLVPSPILTALDAPLRVLIEGAYARDVNPGIATGIGLLPFRNPIQTALNLVAAIPTGIDDGLAEAAGDPTFRPLGTTAATSPFGVGGPDLPEPPGTLEDETTTLASVPESDPAPAPDPPGTLEDETTTLASVPEPDPAPAPEPLDETVVAEEDPEPDAKPVDTGDASTPAATVQDRPKQPSTRHAGDRPLSRVLKSLTGQRPEPAAEADESGDGGQGASGDQKQDAA